jgi:hypothetical protein
MGIITIISILLPYFIFIIWAFNLKKDNRKLRAEFFKKLSDSETERDNIFLDFQKAVIENFKIANENNKGQDENWRRAKKKFDKLDRINQEHLEIFQEFDYIIQELDKKVNEVSDEQEEILMRKDLEDRQINIMTRELDKLTLKRDRYENRLTEVCKALNEIKDSFNKNVNITIDNFEATNGRFGIVQRNFDKAFKSFKQIEEDIKSIESRIKRPDIEINTEALAHKVVQIDRTLNKVIQRQLQRQSETKKLKEILENPIEVTKPSCETKLKLKEQVNQNDVESVTEIINKVEFEWLGHKFEEGSVFIWKNGNLEAKRYTSKNNAVTVNFRESFAQSLWVKVLELNEPKPKRKYTKRNEK